MGDRLLAGVIGASGMGKHHAKWLNALGCEVTFAGTSEASVATTTQTLADLFGFTGQGYAGVETMLDARRPDLVVIASPAALHHEHFMQACERGCHILCEKALQWDERSGVQASLGLANEMVQAAADRGIVAAINTQYVAAAEPYFALCGQAGKTVSQDGFTEFFMQMDSRGGKLGASGEKVWIDLGSHPLSVLMAVAGPGEMLAESACCEIDEKRCEAHFIWRTDAGREISATIVCCNVPEGPLVRRLGVDGVLADYEGRNDEDGVYAAYLMADGAEMKATDFVQTSVARFVGAVKGECRPLATVDDGLTNLAMQLRLLELSRA